MLEYILVVGIFLILSFFVFIYLSNAFGKINSGFGYVGTFTQKDGRVEGKGEGIYLMKYEEDEDGEVVLEFSVAAKVESPAFIKVTRDLKNLYCVKRETEDSSLCAYSIDPSDFSLKFLNSISTGFRSLCHVEFDQNEKFIFTTNYIGGCITMFERTECGEIICRDKVIVTGSSIHKKQNCSKVHSSLVSRDNNTLFVADLGSDKIWVFKILHNKKKLKPAGFVLCRPGSGPRMIRFVPPQEDSENENEKDLIICMNQLDSTLSLFSLNDKLCEVELVEESYVSSKFSGKGSTTSSDTHSHPSGKYVYGSIRDSEDDGIIIARIENDKLEKISELSCHGEVPRGFAITKDGRLCFVANQDSDSVVVFSVSSITGEMKKLKTFQVPTPVCIEWIENL